MARGSQAKQEITQKLLSVFEGSFLYNDGKEIRIPFVENGEKVEIKVALTCAKENVGGNVDIPVAVSATTENTKLTDQEVKEVKDLIKTLNL